VDELADSLGDSTDISTSTTSSNSSGSSTESITHDHSEKVQALVDAAVLCVWIEVDPDPQYGAPPFEPLARFFGLWHEHRRGAHKGLHEFYWENKYVLLLNAYISRDQAQFSRQHAKRGASGTGAAGGINESAEDAYAIPPPDYMSLLYASSTYRSLKPADVPILAPKQFNDQLSKKIAYKKAAVDIVISGAKIVAAANGGMSCDTVCNEYAPISVIHPAADGNGSTATAHKFKCAQNKLYLANTCHAMTTHFDCKAGCGEGLVGFGKEHPAHVVPEAPVQGGQHRPGACAISTNVQMATCDASYQFTRRLCVCVPV